MKAHAIDRIDQAATTEVLPGMSFAVQPGLRHQMEALEDSDMFEFSTRHEEADSIRVIKGD